MKEQLEVMDGDLSSLESLWDGDLGDRYQSYRRAAADPRVALAAALVETAVDLQRLGREAAAPGELLMGDLCLARASRLLADAGDQGLQIAFARAVEEVASAAAAGRPMAPMRELLCHALENGR